MFSIGRGSELEALCKIQGKIRMSFFALDCAYMLVQSGVDPGPGQHLCKESDGGVIETEDGARITFDTRGYGLRGADPSFPKRWRLGMGVQFSTTDKRYEWLNTTFGFWEGQLDEEKGTASYKAYYADTTNLASKYVVLSFFSGTPLKVLQDKAGFDFNHLSLLFRKSSVRFQARSAASRLYSEGRFSSKNQCFVPG